MIFKKNGFLILEVLIAFSILLLGITAAFKIQIAANHNWKKAHKLFHKIQNQENTFEEILAQDFQTVLGQEISPGLKIATIDDMKLYVVE